MVLRGYIVSNPSLLYLLKLWCHMADIGTVFPLISGLKMQQIIIIVASSIYLVVILAKYQKIIIQFTLGAQKIIFRGC